MVAPLHAFDRAFEQMPLVAILRGVKPDEVLPLADLLIEAGFTLIEIPLNSPDPFTSIRRLVEHCPAEVLVGAGTVLLAEDARRLGDLGARLLVTPNTDCAVIRAGCEAGLVPIIGCLTPSEAFTALACGAAALKLFPAGRLAPGYAGDIKTVLPTGTRLLGVGGIGTGQIAAYRAGGYDGFGIGSSLYRPGRPADEVGALARELVAQWRSGG
ncbi:MAG: 2-dehydro-3-deoxy-6-phosphogalactonate aldolase [Chromatiaceae bacterium]|nr:2-dehydro-3-deoxy-6-phosphogalactonate aldolase [Gammaproteobacteria bacterium]MCP5428495.1 2-dehydro-3-deoxy-6-phosphogalactonate aldolase [Chromatiaceae bacterium]MCP5447430.1 2-dehydro-3-deoxy-6-phosphogalactonate aldolase [Chromatiaceae bacterium]